MQGLTLNEEWYNFLLLNNVDINYKKEETSLLSKIVDVPSPKEEIKDNIIDDYSLSISTQTKVLFLNHLIDIEDIFWKINIIEYWKPECGVIRKQIKIVSKNKEDYVVYIIQ